MQIFRTQSGIIVRHQEQYFINKQQHWDTFINQADLYEIIATSLSSWKALEDEPQLFDSQLLKPIESQEVWAAGVTYYRSRDARMEESQQAGGGSFYDRVYAADRPELFFKATASRVVGPGEKVRIRQDSAWNVPEPELTLLVASSGDIVGYTIGNDMSSRSIEGENPLYLPQAKSYDQSAALGPGIYLSPDSLSPDTVIAMQIERGSKIVFEDETQVNQIKRSLESLVEYLYRECSFPHGCFLMTGTGIIPGNDFTLQSGDVIRITIEPIGTLVNTVA